MSKNHEPRLMGAEEFRAIRKLLDLTQPGLAGLLYVTRDAISKWESGVRPVPPLIAQMMREMARGWQPSWWP